MCKEVTAIVNATVFFNKSDKLFLNPGMSLLLICATKVLSLEIAVGIVYRARIILLFSLNVISHETGQKEKTIQIQL